MRARSRHAEPASIAPRARSYRRSTRRNRAASPQTRKSKRRSGRSAAHEGRSRAKPDNRDGVEARRQTGGTYGFARTYGEGMVRRTNAARGGRESVSVMKGEVDSSILSGSTISSFDFRTVGARAFAARPRA